MTDIVLTYDPENFLIDLAIVDNDLLADDGLYTCIIISLYTDRQAISGDVIPDAAIGQASDARGWWADWFNDSPLGSRLWLLWREKQMNSVLKLAEGYARQALNWLLEDGLVLSIAVEAFNPAPALMDIQVRVSRQIGQNIKTEQWNVFFDYNNPQPVFIRN